MDRWMHVREQEGSGIVQAQIRAASTTRPSEGSNGCSSLTEALSRRDSFLHSACRRLLLQLRAEKAAPSTSTSSVVHQSAALHQKVPLRR